MPISSAQPHASVIIVGAGPTGLAAALELTRQGVAVRIFDMSKMPNTESRGTGLQARTLELIDLYGVTDVILSQANMANAFIVYQSGEDVGRIDLTLASPRFAGSPALPQAITERILRDRLAELGIAVEFGIEVTTVDRDEHHCVVHAIGPDGAPFSTVADWVIGADGARSPIRTMLDLPFDGVSYPEGWGLMDATLDWPWSPDAVRIFRGEGPQQFVAVPLGGKTYRLQVDHRDAAVQGDPPTVAEMQAAYDAYVPVPGTISDATWRSAFRVHRRQVVAYREGRILLAGDAAHIHTPAGAQGLNTGIQDGINLGWKLALVVSGDADAALLDSYQDERKPIAAGVLQLSEVLARNPLAMLGDGTIPPAQLSARIGQLLVNYRDGPLGQTPGRRAGQLVAGDRLPDVTLGGAPLYHRLRDAGITVAIVGSATDTDALRARWGDAIRLWHVDADDPDGLFAAAVGLRDGAAVIRPDAYLGIVADGDATDAVTAWLADTLHLTPQGMRPDMPLPSAIPA